MFHKHQNHHTRCALAFLLGLLLTGGMLGGVSGYFGRGAVEGVWALRSAMITRSIGQGEQQRRLRKERRLVRGERIAGDVVGISPVRTTALERDLGSRKWEVALNVGFLSYPRLGIAAPVAKPSLKNWKDRNWRALEGQMQFGLLHGVVAYPHSPEPGEEGNIVIAGHSSPPTPEAMGSSYKDVFAVLPEARIGDLVEIRDEDNVAFVYKVISSREVPATKTDILLQPAGERKLTLFTCYPIGTTRNRWVVELELVEGAAVVGG